MLNQNPELEIAIDGAVYGYAELSEMLGLQRDKPRQLTSNTSKLSTAEEKFWNLWQSLDGWELQTQYKFHPQRNWLCDFVDVPSKTIVEIEGMVYQGAGGRHQRPYGYEGDCEKYNAAVELGYAVFRLTPSMITEAWIRRIQKFMLDNRTYV